MDPYLDPFYGYQYYGNQPNDPIQYPIDPSGQDNSGGGQQGGGSEQPAGNQTSTSMVCTSSARPRDIC